MSSTQALYEGLSILLADTYAIYLKTQNYHWHVTGPSFVSLHGLFEKQYLALSEAVDLIAERIRILGYLAPATFSEFQALTTLKEGQSVETAEYMLSDLIEDHFSILVQLKTLTPLAEEVEDEGTLNMISERLSAHEKMRWMLMMTV